MKAGVLLVLALASATGRAATSYVSDELLLGVYAERNGQGARIATLHSGDGVETLATDGEYTQVRLNGGATGWVKTSFLVAREPASVRVKQLEDELARTRAATPDLPESARGELDGLRRALDDSQAQLKRALDENATLAAAAAGGSAGRKAPAAPLWMSAVAALLALALGFWLGHALLARRLRQKFGGIKVY